MCVQTDEFGDSEQGERGGGHEKAKAGKTEICFSVFLLKVELSMNRQGQFQMRSFLKPGRHWHFYVGSTATFFSEVGVGLEISNKSRSLSESVSCPFRWRLMKWKDSIGLCLILAFALNAAKRRDQNSWMPRTLLFYFPDCGQATTDPMNHSLGSLWLLTFHWANHCCEAIGSHWEVKPETSFWLLAVSTAARPLEFPAGDFAISNTCSFFRALWTTLSSTWPVNLRCL